MSRLGDDHPVCVCKGEERRGEVRERGEVRRGERRREEKKREEREGVRSGVERRGKGR